MHHLQQPAENKDTFRGFLKTPFPHLYLPYFLTTLLIARRKVNTLLLHTLFFGWMVENMSQNGRAPGFSSGERRNSIQAFVKQERVIFQQVDHFYAANI